MSTSLASISDSNCAALPIPETPPKSKVRTTSPSQHQKACSLCQKPRDVLVRCQTSLSGEWLFVCPGKCWKEVSGGVIDGDGKEGHEGYRYGGMWKNKWAGVSAKKKTKLKKNKRSGPGQNEDGPATEQGTEDGGESSAVNVVSEWRGDMSDAHEDQQCQYTRNDRVLLDGTVWVCRRTHVGSGERNERRPGVGYRFWKEAD